MTTEEELVELEIELDEDAAVQLRARAKRLGMTAEELMRDTIVRLVHDSEFREEVATRIKEKTDGE